jgi:uncharacterized membrane protein
MTRAELKAMAKEQIKGNIGTLFVIGLIVAVISAAAGAVPVVGSVATAIVLAPAFTIATIMIYLKLTQGVKPEIKELFAHFDKFWAAFKVSFLAGLYTFLWSLLLVIPGIVKSYSYAMSLYILAENPELSAREAIDRSKAMMDGHKMELFVLTLSFIGWALLGTLTMGILYIWLIPYFSATMANFYNSIKPAVTVE